MNIKQQLEHAEKYEYPVGVMFKGCVRKGSIVETGQASFVMSFSGAAHYYAAVVSVEPVEPETSILEQEWHFVEDAGYAGGGQVYDAENSCVNFVKWKRQIAALPDMARALKRVWVRWEELRPDTDWTSQHQETMGTVWDAIKKSGIE